MLCRAFYPHGDDALVSTLLGFILAIAARPKMLVLAESAANLDVVVRHEILDDILDSLWETGTTVMRFARQEF